jgi:transcriptional regulator with XRE-family HTH domain
MSERFKRVLERTAPEIKRRIEKSFLISDQILDMLEEKNVTQKQLAVKLGKSESEISKWMKGDHNFTIDTIVKVEVALGGKIIDTPKNFRKELKKPVLQKEVTNGNRNFNIPLKPFAVLTPVSKEKAISERKFEIAIKSALS